MEVHLPTCLLCNRWALARMVACNHQLQDTATAAWQVHLAASADSHSVLLHRMPFHLESLRQAHTCLAATPKWQAMAAFSLRAVLTAELSRHSTMATLLDRPDQELMQTERTATRALTATTDQQTHSHSSLQGWASLESMTATTVATVKAAPSHRNNLFQVRHVNST